MLRDDRNKEKAARIASRVPSHLRSFMTPSDIVTFADVDTSIPTLSSATAESTGGQLGAESTDTSKSLVWNADELRWRNDLPLHWKDICNASCHRKPFLHFFAEPFHDPTMVRARDGLCCSGCTPSLLPTLTEAPKGPKAPTKPIKNSRADFGLRILDPWLKDQANRIFIGINRRFRVPVSAYITDDCRWQIARMWTTRPRLNLDIDNICTIVPLLEKWEYYSTDLELLVAQLQELDPAFEEA
jgi:hypothetical protein